MLTTLVWHSSVPVWLVPTLRQHFSLVPVEGEAMQHVASGRAVQLAQAARQYWANNVVRNWKEGVRGRERGEGGREGGEG